MKILSIFTVVVLTTYNLSAQNSNNAKQIKVIADSLYKIKDFNNATDYYIKLINLSDFKSKKVNAAYNAACCLALQNKKDSAFLILQSALKIGTLKKKSLTNDSDFKNLLNDKRWPLLLSKAQEENALNDNPAKAKFVTDDIHRFWKAYELYLKDTANAHAIFKTHYFDKASVGMDDYMNLKVSTINQFVRHIKTHPKFYSTIKGNTLKADAYKAKYKQSFKNLKLLYPKANFPDVYFIIGALTSAGTVSDAGLLLGLNQICKDDKTNLEELDFAERLLVNKIALLPEIVAHELIHFQQGEMAKDTITLAYAIKEGMADFIGELISGKTANPQLIIWVKGKEKKVWENFKKDMFFDRYERWLANYDNASDENFPDLGYWVGYEICKSYYENAMNKKQAVYDMLHIKDYRKFLVDSKWEEKINTY
jgi:hypothetical protein